MITKLAYKQLRRRPVTTGLLLLIIALSVGVSVFLMTLHQGLQKGLTLATEPFSLLVSAPGSQHQLVLNAVFLQDRPLPNIPYEEVNALQKKEKLVKSAIPLAFGDSYQGYRIVGSSRAIFQMKAYQNSSPWLSLQEGRPFEKPFEAVIGRDVASRLHLKIGSTFESTHGLLPKSKQAHKGHPFTVVGILKDVQGPYNQVILTPIESVWEVHAHKEQNKLALELAQKTGRPLPEEKHEKEVSAILIEPVGYSQAYQLASQYQSRKDAMLVFPAQTIVQFFNLMGRGEKMWRPVGGFLMALSILIVVITSYLSTLTRLGEYAVMRALGAKEKQIAAIWLWQNTFLIAGGTILGTILGLGVYVILAHFLAASTAVTLPVYLPPLTIALLAGAVVVGILASLLPMTVLKRKLKVTVGTSL
jgi:putative ABC transport system permease protein